MLILCLLQKTTNTGEYVTQRDQIRKSDVDAETKGIFRKRV